MRPTAFHVGVVCRRSRHAFADNVRDDGKPWEVPRAAVSHLAVERCVDRIVLLILKRKRTLMPAFTPACWCRTDDGPPHRDRI